MLILFFEESYERGQIFSTASLKQIAYASGSKVWNYLRPGRNSIAVEPDEETPLLPNLSPHCSSSSVSTMYSGPILSLNMVLIIGTIGIFNLCTQVFNKLLTVLFCSAPPVGTGMPPDQLGYAFAASIVACMAFQMFFFRRIEGIFGYTCCYQVSFLISCITFFITPLMSLIRSRVVLWIGLICMMTLKIVTEFFGPTAALLLVQSSYLMFNTRLLTLLHLRAHWDT
jgi:hypothetical protein